jgi:enoyl-CoA hydratase/carnithine racemase
MRMGPADAIHAGFADHFVPEAEWPALIADLCAGGDAGLVAARARTPGPSRLPQLRMMVDRHFASADPRTIEASLAADDSDFARDTLSALRRNSPLSVAVALEMQRRLGPAPALRDALEQEFRVTFRAQQDTDFLEGVRALTIDKDRRPRWRHAGAEAVPQTEIAALLAPLGRDTLTFTESGTEPGS